MKILSPSATLIILLVFLLLQLSCREKHEKQPCYRDLMVNHSFASIPTPEDSTVNYITFTGKEMLEEANGRVVYRYEVIWRACNWYSLVERWSAYSEGGLRLDTLQVWVLGKNRDTLTIHPVEEGRERNIRVYRVGE